MEKKGGGRISEVGACEMLTSGVQVQMRMLLS